MNARPGNPNLDHLVAAAAKVKPLLDQIAFVGGCVTGLLLTDAAALRFGPHSMWTRLLPSGPMPNSRNWRPACTIWALSILSPKAPRYAAG